MNVNYFDEHFVNNFKKTEKSSNNSRNISNSNSSCNTIKKTSTNSKTPGSIKNCNNLKKSSSKDKTSGTYSNSSNLNNSKTYQTVDHQSTFMNNKINVIKLNTFDYDQESNFFSSSIKTSKHKQENGLNSSIIKKSSRSRSIDLNSQLEELNKIISRQTSKSKMSSAGERLFEASILLNAKIQSKFIMKEMETKMRSVPSLSKKSRQIIRDPQLFGERLYPYHKVKSSTIEACGSVGDLYGNTPSAEVYRNSNQKNFDNFNFTPKLNKRSLEIADTMPSSLERLYQKKKKKKSNKSCEDIIMDNILKARNNHNSNHKWKATIDVGTHSLIRSEISYNNLNVSIQSKSSLSAAQRSFTRTNELYEKGLISLKKKETNHVEKLSKDSEIYKNFAYRPLLIHSKRTKKYIQSNGSTGRMSKLSFSSKSHSPAVEYITNQEPCFYKKNSSWKNSIEAKSNKSKSLKEKGKIEECTFSPSISCEIPSPDLKFISKNIHHTHEYIYKRRLQLIQKEEMKEYAKKKLNFGENFIIKQTIPKEFNFSKSISRRSIINQNKPIINHNPNLIKELRRKLSTDKFFS